MATRSARWPSLPPLELVGLVAGPRDLHWFLEGGKLAVESIVGILEKHAIHISGLESILDFGCGSGRSIRHFKFLAERTRLAGVDYNPKLIAWCEQNLRFAQFETNNVSPPLNFPDASISLTYALSVFTHFPEDLQHQWIDELRRILIPGGFLLITTHGERYLSELTPEQRESFQAGNVVVRSAGEVGSNRYGAYHPREFVTKKLCGEFALMDFEPEGARGNPYQDLYLFRKR